MIADFLSPLRNTPEFDQSLDISPYAGLMGFRLRRQDGRLTTVMPYHADLIGSPFPPVLHGGTIAALMEMAALMQLLWDRKINYIPKTIDITIDYLRSGQPQDCFARGHVFRQGRRFATLHVQAWQADTDKPVATAMVHFQLTAQG
ncbi:MAG: PaaI family thioesterase [Alphaproteobacteria bacterium]|nr:PaaI family thioesterase [Alphaproteobacteria bacterium]